MAFSAEKQTASAFNNNNEYKDDDSLQPATINNLIKGLLYAQASGASGKGSVNIGSGISSVKIQFTNLGDNDAIFISPSSAIDKTNMESDEVFVTANDDKVTFTRKNTATARTYNYNYFIARGQ